MIAVNLMTKQVRQALTDHDHITGKFRFILCSGCNITLGYAKENPEILRNLATLLEAYERT